MLPLRNRICTQCLVGQMTRSKADICLTCTTRIRQEGLAQAERKHLETMYTNVVGPVVDKHKHRTWTFIHSCGTEQTWVYGNILKRLREDPDIIPCSACGGKRRAANATAGYVAKYGITEEQLAEFTRYSKKVRGITDTVYKQYKEEINPQNLKRGQGPDDYHLDHIVTIHFGFHNGLEPEFIARKENLQMLTSKENLSKGRK